MITSNELSFENKLNLLISFKKFFDEQNNNT